MSYDAEWWLICTSATTPRLPRPCTSGVCRRWQNTSAVARLTWAVGERANTVLALEAWRDAKRGLRRWGMNVEDVIVHHDQDPVFTGYGWTDQLLIKDHVRVSYALRGARDNPEMESFFGRLKVENHSIFLDAQTLKGLRAIVAERMQYYNRERRHSTLGNRAPETFTRSLTQEG